MRGLRVSFRLAEINQCLLSVHPTALLRAGALCRVLEEVVKNLCCCSGNRGLGHGSVCDLEF